MPAVLYGTLVYVLFLVWTVVNAQYPALFII